MPKPKDNATNSGRVAFEAQVHSVKVGMNYGDKEATLVMKFKPAEGVVDTLQGLIGGDGDNTVMVGIVPIASTGKSNGVQEGSERKPKRPRERVEKQDG